MHFVETAVSGAPGAVRTRLLVVGGTLAVIRLLAEVTERRKEIWCRGIAQLWRVVQARLAFAPAEMSRGISAVGQPS